MRPLDEDGFFERYRSALRCGRLFRDGIVDPDEYARARRRIVFILKEANDGEVDQGQGDVDLCGFLRAGGRSATWNNVARWTKTILEAWSWTAGPIGHEERRGVLRSIAIVNLKKVGGRAATHRASLRSAAVEGRYLLSEQIEHLAPEVVVCCGADTGNLAGELLYGFGPPEWERVHRSTWVAPERIRKALICMPHPQARRSGREMHEGLTKALRVVSERSGDMNHNRREMK